MMKNEQATISAPWDQVDEALRRLLASKRAAMGWSWEDVAREVGKRGWQITAGNLMTRHSRMSFRANELVVLLDAMGIDAVRALRAD